MKRIFLFLLGLWALIPTYGQDPIEDPTRFKLRLGGGGQVGVSLFSTGELNEYARDIWDNYKVLYPGLQDKPDILKYRVGFIYQYKVDVRLLNFFTFEAWREEMQSLKMKVYCDLFDPLDPTAFLKAKNEFTPGFSAEGLNLILTPGARTQSVFFSFGGGYGRYDLNFNHYANESKNWAGETGSFEFEKDFKAELEALHAIVGLTYVAAEVFEFETFFTYRWVSSDRMETKSGEVMINPFRSNKTIQGNFSGYDFRIGLKLMIP